MEAGGAFTTPQAIVRHLSRRNGHLSVPRRCRASNYRHAESHFYGALGPDMPYDQHATGITGLSCHRRPIRTSKCAHRVGGRGSCAGIGWNSLKQERPSWVPQAALRLASGQRSFALRAFACQDRSGPPACDSSRGAKPEGNPAAGWAIVPGGSSADATPKPSIPRWAKQRGRCRPMPA